MRRLLILAPAFPPHPSPATHRARFLARYGPRFGWDVAVLTLGPENYEEELDRELARLVPRDLVVHHAGAWPARWTRRLGVGNLALRSYIPLRRALMRLVADRRPDLIFIPCPPFYNAMMAAEMRRRFGVPYVPDFTDPWVFPVPPDEDHWTRKAYWANRLAMLLEPTVVRRAAHVVAVSEGTNDLLRTRYPDVPADRFSALPFGFEPSDYEALRDTAPLNRYWDAEDGNLHLAYVGVVPPDFHESVRALFAGVQWLRSHQPVIAARLRLHFLGTSYAPAATRGPVLPLAIEAGVADVVQEHVRRISYVDALHALTRADGLLALGSTQRHYTASKIFACLLARRPLLALSHEESTVCDIVRAVGGVELITYDDVHRVGERAAEIGAALVRVVEAAGQPRPALDLSAVHDYTAERICERLFATFGEVTRATRPTAPASSRVATYA